MRKILVVEDDIYKTAARGYFKSIKPRSVRPKLAYFSDCRSALMHLSEKRPDGIITGTLLPYYGDGQKIGYKTGFWKGAIKTMMSVEPDDKIKSCLDELMKAIKEDEAIQPLGIWVGHIAEKDGIPFVLSLSPHKLSALTVNYARLKKWRIVPSEYDKAEPIFWEKAIELLTDPSLVEDSED